MKQCTRTSLEWEIEKELNEGKKALLPLSKNDDEAYKLVK